MNRASDPVTLVARFAGPLQSWSLDRGRRRVTQLAPTKSGVVGICARSLGIDLSNGEQWAPLAAMRLGVRVDRPGHLLEDYQTAGGGRMGGRGYFVARADRKQQVTERWQGYLSDAAFLVCLEGDRGLVDDLAGALEAPAHCWGLGKLSCPPLRPVVLDVVECGVHGAVGAYGLVDGTGQVPVSGKAEWDATVVDAKSQRRFDVPVDFVERRYVTRFVTTATIEVATIADAIGVDNEEVLV